MHLLYGYRLLSKRFHFFHQLSLTICILCSKQHTILIVCTLVASLSLHSIVKNLNIFNTLYVAVWTCTEYCLIVFVDCYLLLSIEQSLFNTQTCSLYGYLQVDENSLFEDFVATSLGSPGLHLDLVYMKSFWDAADNRSINLFKTPSSWIL